METQPVTFKNDDVLTSLFLIQKIFEYYHPRNFNVRLWDGTQWDSESGRSPVFTIVIRHPGALQRMFLPPNELTLGEAYIYNDFDIEGDLEEAFLMSTRLLTMQLSLPEKIELGLQLFQSSSGKEERKGRQAVQLEGKLHSKERDRQAVTYHYNVSNDFFALWLDQEMVYSCAYFNSPDETLDDAQKRKLDYICRKLRLKPGERLLDIGCGWGGLIRYAVKEYGVTALGITLSEPQVQLANERISREGLSDRCKAVILDYREINEPEGYDKIVSVGMFEHVGESKLPEYFKGAWNLLRPGGLFLNHGIASCLNQPEKKGPSFSDKYIFPDGELLPISTTLQVAETTGFEVRDVESLREHYMLTLRNWLKRLEANHEMASQLTDETTYRTWQLNHAGSAVGFQTGRLNIYQTLMIKPVNGESRLPLTRADWYK